MSERGVFTQKSPVAFKHILDFNPDASIWWAFIDIKGGGGSGMAEEKGMNGAQRRLFQYPDTTTQTRQRRSRGRFHSQHAWGYFRSFSSSSSPPFSVYPLSESWGVFLPPFCLLNFSVYLQK